MQFDVEDHSVYAYTGTRAIDKHQPTICFIHGGALDHTVWLLQSRYFAHHGYNALAVDLPGHGRSARPLLPTIAAMADWCIAVLDALEIERATLVGHSMGSLVALEGAAQHPRRVASLALLGIAVPMPVTDQLLTAAEANDHAAFDMVNLWGHGHRTHIGGNQVPGMWMTGSGVRLLERSGPGVLHNDLKACTDYLDGLSSASRVQCKTQLILGAEDRMSPHRTAQRLIDALAQVSVSVLEHCGHMMLAERPDSVSDVLIDFIDRS